MTGPLFPSNLTKVWIRGTFIDLAGNPKTGTVSFTPSASLFLDIQPRLIISSSTFTAILTASTGKFAIQIPVTNDPDIIPESWTYRVDEPSGRSYNISVPIETPLLNSPGDPLHGQQVIDLIDIVPAPSPQPGTVQLVTGAPGRGIDDAVVDSNGYLVLAYSDGTTDTVGFVGGSSGGGSGSRAYHHEQIGALATWTIAHGMGFKPAGVIARDATGLIEPADITYPDLDTCVLHWSVAVAGSADLS